MPLLTINNESAGDAEVTSVTLEFPSEQITVEELIRSHVYQQVTESNAKLASRPRVEPIVQPSEQEVALNGKALDAPTAQWQVEFEKTKDAFRKNQIFVLVDGEQTTSLSDIIQITPSTDVRFLRLTMLMGG